MTDEGMSHVCYFRHALALHERRVKFLPEYVRGGLGPEVSPGSAYSTPPHTKEVWFAGSHSDIGGGADDNDALKRFGPSLRWMSFEATQFGLLLDNVPSNWPEAKISESLSWWWTILEYIPFPRLSYTGTHDLLIWPHRGQPRVIKSGQIIHESAKICRTAGRATVSENLSWDDLVDDSRVEKDSYAAARLITNAMKMVRDAEQQQLLNREHVQALESLVGTEPGRQSLQQVKGLFTAPSLGSLLLRALSALGNSWQEAASADSRSALEMANTVIAALQALCERYPPAEVRLAAQAIAPIDAEIADKLMVALSSPQLRSPLLYQNGVSYLVFLPHGRRLVSGFGEGIIRISSVEESTDTLVLSEHKTAVSCLDTHGWRIASCSYDGTFCVWEADSGKLALGPIEACRRKRLHSVSFSRDGTRIATGGEDARAVIWDAYTGRQICEMVGHSATVLGVAFSQDASLLVSGSEDCDIRIWDAASGQFIADLLQHSSTVSAVLFGSDDDRIYSSSYDMTVCVWNAETRQLVYPPLKLEAPALRLSLSPDGHLIAAGSSNGGVTLWDSDTGTVIQIPFVNHAERVWGLAFSPDGRQLASGSEDGTVAFWDVTGEWRRVEQSPASSSTAVSGHEHSEATTWDDLSPDPYIATKRALEAANRRAEEEEDLADEDLQVLSVVARTELGRVTLIGTHQLLEYAKPVKDILLQVLARYVLALSSYHTSSVDLALKRINTLTTIIHALEERFPPPKVRSLARPLAKHDPQLADELMTRFSDPALRSPSQGHTSSVSSVAFLPDGRRLVSSSQDGTVRIWDIKTGETVIGPLKGHTSNVRCAAVYGSRIASCSYDGMYRVWDADSGELILGPITAHDGKYVGGIAYSRDGTRIATAGYDNRAAVWDSSTGVQLREMVGHTAPVMCVAFSEDGTRLVSGSQDNTVRLWEVASGECIGEPLTGQSSWVRAVCFGRDDKRIFSCSADRTIQICDAETRALIVEPLRMDHDGLSMALSPDGKRLVSGSRSGSIAMWDAETGVAIQTPFRDHGAEVWGVAFSPDGRKIASASEDKTIALCDATDDWKRYDIDDEDVDKDNA